MQLGLSIRTKVSLFLSWLFPFNPPTRLEALRGICQTDVIYGSVGVVGTRTGQQTMLTAKVGQSVTGAEEHAAKSGDPRLVGSNPARCQPGYKNLRIVRGHPRRRESAA
jgi:hypothetical protein